MENFGQTLVIINIIIIIINYLCLLKFNEVCRKKFA